MPKHSGDVTLEVCADDTTLVATSRKLLLLLA
jgi:hypothetical protein